MAIIKHIASKNANYGAAQLYLTFQHDEQTNRPLLDEHGHYIPREEYLISGVLCTPDSFALDCVKDNLRYGQNQKKGDIKTHHYIISFDPRDQDDHGLTLEEVQKMGEAFCREHFPGHQALVCSHPDGHHGAGNLHCHIVINSLRIEEVERKSYMDRPCDSRAGAKHRCTGKFMRYLREQVMAMCEERGLYQVDLLSGAQKKVTDREYHAQQRGQATLDRENALLNAQGKTPKETVFDTQKEELRQAIDATWPQCSTLAEFVQRLFQDYGIETTESRGRFSYLHPKAKKKVADRRLGEGYRKGAIEHGIDEQNHRRELPGRGEQGTAFVLSAQELSAAAQLAGADFRPAGAGQVGLDLADHQQAEQAGVGEQPAEGISVQPYGADDRTERGAESVLPDGGDDHEPPRSIRERLQWAHRQLERRKSPTPEGHKRSHEPSL
jgi:hypothetical protein